MPERTCLAIILAAGEGTRMRSSRPKAMHKIAGLPLLGHVRAAAREADATRIVAVVGPGWDDVRAFAEKTMPETRLYEQAERLGTAHAVLAAAPELEESFDDVVVLYGDTPFIRPETIAAMRRALAEGADLVVVGFRPDDPAGYGRLILDGGRLVAIREIKDASPAERSVGLCNAGVMAFRGGLVPLLHEIGKDNAKGEFYLTDMVALASAAGRNVTAIEAPADEVLGVNTRAELAEAEAAYQDRRRRAAMEAGVTMIAPETVYFSHDTRVGRDVVIEPNVMLGPGVTIEDGATIHAFCYFEGATVAASAEVGPFARLRPGARIGPSARIGNFVEVKNSVVESGVKASHLAYIGDTHVGANTNIGAGAITCNYDGFGKHRTEIGAGAFIGANSALVAPLTIGEGAYVATGSVINKDVAPGALAIARERQVEKPGWAERFRALKAGLKRSKA